MFGDNLGKNSLSFSSTYPTVIELIHYGSSYGW